MSPPTKPQPLPVAEGKEFVATFVKQFSAGFAANNHTETMKGLFAPKMSWSWSDDTRGEGTPDDILGIFSKSWGAMVDNFVLSL